MYKNLSIICIGILLTLATHIGYASGGYGGGSYGGGGYVSRPVDPLYEQGRLIYSGKSGDYGKIKWCIATDDGKQK